MRGLARRGISSVQKVFEILGRRRAGPRPGAARQQVLQALVRRAGFADIDPIAPGSLDLLRGAGPRTPSSALRLHDQRRVRERVDQRVAPHGAPCLELRRRREPPRARGASEHIVARIPGADDREPTRIEDVRLPATVEGRGRAFSGPFLEAPGIAGVGAADDPDRPGAPGRSVRDPSTLRAPAGFRSASFSVRGGPPTARARRGRAGRGPRPDAWRSRGRGAHLSTSPAQAFTRSSANRPSVYLPRWTVAPHPPSPRTQSALPDSMRCCGGDRAGNAVSRETADGPASTRFDRQAGAAPGGAGGSGVPPAPGIRRSAPRRSTATCFPAALSEPATRGRGAGWSCRFSHERR